MKRWFITNHQKNAMRYHIHIDTHTNRHRQTQKMASIGEDVEKLEICALLVRMQNDVSLWKTIQRFLKTIKIELYDPAIPLLGTQTKKLKAGWKTFCITIFILVLCLIPKRWKQPKCPWKNEQIKENVVNMYSGILFILKKEGNPVICYNMKEP